MAKDRKKVKREKKRLKFIREAKERRNAIKYNPDRIFPNRRYIGFDKSNSKK